MNISIRLLGRMLALAARLPFHLLLVIALVPACADLRAQERDEALGAGALGAAVQASDANRANTAPPGPSGSGTFSAATSNVDTSRTGSSPLDSSRSVATGAAPSAGPPAKQSKADGALDLRIPLPIPEMQAGETARAVRIVLALTLLAILPSLLVCLSSFLRIVIVLSMLRHAIGMPETPPNTVVIGLALFLTLFTMNPVLQQVNSDAFQPFMAGDIGVEQGIERVAKPLRQFMLRQTREQDLALMVELSKSSRPQSIDDVGNLQLIPAFMLSELRAAFQIGFVIFLPFLLIDLIVSSILMSLGMMMMPPVTLSLPIKILMFILVDGWGVLVKALVTSFH